MMYLFTNHNIHGIFSTLHLSLLHSSDEVLPLILILQTHCWEGFCSPDKLEGEIGFGQDILTLHDGVDESAHHLKVIGLRDRDTLSGIVRGASWEIKVDIYTDKNNGT